MDNPSTYQKASRINLDPMRHGVFAEIGAGQEVARWFFHVGGAAGTVAKTICAYDMAVSDAFYGPTDHYVSRRRLEAMLEREFISLLDLLGAKRGDGTAFFVFANTLATRSYSRHEDGHGWMGIRFQNQPGMEASEIIIHVRMLDRENVREQEAIGIIGVNLLHAALYHYDDPPGLIGDLLENLTRDRVEVDLIRFSGPCFREVDNRLMSLQLVEQGLTEAAFFTDKGEVVQAAEILYKKPVLIERGSFRPVTKTVVQMLESARGQFLRKLPKDEGTPVVLMEMSLGNLLEEGRIDHADFLARSDLLGAIGRTVMISNYGAHHALTTFMRRYSSRPIAFVMGIPTVIELFQEKYYEDLEGGILESLGRLFNGDVILYVGPTRDRETRQLTGLDNLQLPGELVPLYRYLMGEGRLVALERPDAEPLDIHPSDVRAMIRDGNPNWESLVPSAAVETIKRERLFGFAPTGP